MKVSISKLKQDLLSLNEDLALALNDEPLKAGKLLRKIAETIGKIKAAQLEVEGL